MFYITISNGLLTKDHQKRMGAAVWQFMWCIDKVTKIDDKGDGWVLGGKPINLKDLPFGSRTTNSRNLNELEKQGYITLIHTPYGISIRVKKAKKRFTKSDKPLKERIIISGKPRPENGKPNKTVSVDSINTSVANKSLRNLKTKKKDMGIRGYDESKHSDDGLPEIDSETGETRSARMPAGAKGKKEKYWEMIHWAEARRGSKFLRQTIVKQFKAFNIAATNSIKPAEMKGRWIEFEQDKFRIEKGFDWLDVVYSFNKKR